MRAGDKLYEAAFGTHTAQAQSRWHQGPQAALAAVPQSLQSRLSLCLLPLWRSCRASAGISCWLLQGCPKLRKSPPAQAGLARHFHQCFSLRGDLWGPVPSPWVLYLCLRQCLSWDLTPPPQVLVHAVHLVHSPHQ